MEPELKETNESSAGFTLLEVLVALAIAAVALSTLIPMLGDVLRRATDTETMSAAILLAQSKLAAIGREHPLITGSSTGTTAEGLRWQARVERYGDAAEQRAWPVAAYAVTVEVRWQERGKDKSIALATLRLGGMGPMR